MQSAFHGCNIARALSTQTKHWGELPPAPPVPTSMDFWKFESLGISVSSQVVHQEFEENISFKDSHYEVRLQWKKPHPILPYNYELSHRHLQGLLRQLHQTPNILQEYDSVIHEQLELGIVQPMQCRILILG